MSVVITTARLTLRPPVPDDAWSLAQHANDMQVARWLLAMPHPYTRADAEDWIARTLAAPEDGLTCVIDRAGEAVGAIGTKGEFGYWLGRAHWGQGLAQEAARALIAAHFEAGGGPLRSSHARGNPRSARVLEAMGFVPTGQEDRRQGRLPEQDHVHRSMRLTRAGFDAVGALP